MFKVTLPKLGAGVMNVGADEGAALGAVENVGASVSSDRGEALSSCPVSSDDELLSLDAVGLEVGGILEVAVGALERMLLGLSVGDPVGLTLGVWLGAALGLALGLALGPRDGLELGLVLGLVLGGELGAAEGLAVGLALGD